MNKQSNALRHKRNSTRRKRKGHKYEQDDRMLIVTNLIQPGRRERITSMNKQSNTHGHKLNLTRRKRKGHKNEQTIECSSWQNSTRRKRRGYKNEQNDRMLIVTSLTQPGGRENVTSMNKTIECSSSQTRLNQGEEKGSQKWTNNRMLIVTS